MGGQAGDRAEAALASLRGLGWSVETAPAGAALPADVLARYPAIPDDVRRFVERLATCMRPGEQAWFLGVGDFAAPADAPGFAWDHWERMETEGPHGRDAAGSRAFWDAHLPILQSVDSDFVYLAVVVDPAAADYGAVVRGEGPDFHEVEQVSATFGGLLEMIAASRPGSGPPEIADLVLPPTDESRLASAPRGFASRWLRRLQSLRMFERYRVGVVVERAYAKPLYTWEAWSQLMPYLSNLIGKLPSQAVIRPRQAGDHDNWLKFGRLPWSEASNRTWTTRYLGDPELAGKVTFFATEVWAPSRAISFDTRRGPEFFCLLSQNKADKVQGLVLAIRADVLRDVDVVADDVIFEFRSLLDGASHAVEVFDRTWGESGRFGSIIVTNGLDYTSPEAVLAWARAHPRARRPSFRWRKSFGRGRQAWATWFRGP